MRNRIIAVLAIAVLMLGASLDGQEKVLRLSGMSAYRELSRGIVVFPHERHYAWGIGCLSCHHRYMNGTNVMTTGELKPGTPAVSCASCHSTGRDLERAYHNKCIKCHEEMAGNSISSGPVMCGQCHSKKGG